MAGDCSVQLWNLLALINIVYNGWGLQCTAMKLLALINIVYNGWGLQCTALEPFSIN